LKRALQQAELLDRPVEDVTTCGADLDGADIAVRRGISFRNSREPPLAPWRVHVDHKDEIVFNEIATWLQPFLAFLQKRDVFLLETSPKGVGEHLNLAPLSLKSRWAVRIDTRG